MDNNSKILQTFKNEMPKSGSPKMLLIGMCALAVFLEAAFLVYFVPARIPEITENTAQIESLTSEVQKLEHAVTVLDQTNSVQLDNDLMITENALPSEKSVTGLVSALTNLATTSGTQVNQIQIAFGEVSTSSGKVAPAIGEVTDVTLANQVIGVPLTMNVAATDLQALDLVGQIQQALPLLGINKFAYIVSGDKQTANLSVLIYSQPSDKFTMAKIGSVTPLTKSELQAIDSLSGKINILQ